MSARHATRMRRSSREMLSTGAKIARMKPSMSTRGPNSRVIWSQKTMTMGRRTNNQRNSWTICSRTTISKTLKMWLEVGRSRHALDISPWVNKTLDWHQRRYCSLMTSNWISWCQSSTTDLSDIVTTETIVMGMRQALGQTVRRNARIRSISTKSWTRRRCSRRSFKRESIVLRRCSKLS